MDRRQMITTTGLGVVGFVTGTAFTAPACGVSKEKAVRYAGLAVGYLKDVLPIAAQMGVGGQFTDLINRAIPAFEKLKDALEKSDIDTAGTTLNTVQSVLGAIATGLFNLPDTPMRAVIMGLVTLVNITVRTISAAVEAEAPPVTVPQMPGSVRIAASPDALKRAFEASRF